MYVLLLKLFICSVITVTASELLLARAICKFLFSFSNVLSIIIPYSSILLLQ